MINRNKVTSLPFLPGFILCICLFSSCRNEKNEKAQVKKDFSGQTKFLAEEGNYIITQIMVRSHSNSIAKLYYNLGKKLNDLVYSEIDTSFAGKNNVDADSLNRILNRLVLDYNTIIDSTKKATSHTVFLKEDEVKVYMKGPTDSIEGSINESDYFNLVHGLQIRHLHALQIIRGCYADYTDQFQLYTNAGCITNVYEKGNATKIVLQFRYYRGNFLYKPLGKVILVSDAGLEIPIENKKINMDTISFTTRKLIHGKYKAVAAYFESFITGYQRTTDISFPFTIE